MTKLAKFTWKEYGVSLNDLMNTCLDVLLDYIDLMNMSEDHENAYHQDTKPKPSEQGY